MTDVLQDYSTDHPGKMGWGTELFTEDERLDKEVRAYAALQKSNQASKIVRAPAKAVVNQKLVEDVRKLQSLDGIEDGFSFMHLERIVFGQVIPWKAQIIGSCVASGGSYADTGRMMVEAYLLQDPEQLFGTEYVGPDNVCPFAPYNYRWGRHYGGLNGNMDGSFCAEHIRGKLENGFLLCSDVQEGYKDSWFPEPQSSSEYKKWGANNNLVNKYSSKVKHYLLESERVTSNTDFIELLTVHLKPMQICSNYGFAPSGTISGWTWNGQPVYQYRRSGNWAHNMTVYGAVKVRGNWWIMIRNSWGFNAHRNGSWFAVSAEDFRNWLKNAECMTIGDIQLPENTNPFPTF